MDSPLGWLLSRLPWPGRRDTSLPVLAARMIEERASQVGQLIFMATGGQIVRSQVRFEDLATEGYENNPIVYRCVRLISDALKSMPVLVFENGEDKTAEHPLAAVLAAPNPDQIWEDLIDSIVGHLVLAGEVFLEGVTLDRSRALMEVYSLRPDKMAVDPGIDGLPRAYRYESNGGVKTFELDPRPGSFRSILHIKNWNPRDHWRGLPALHPAASAGDEHNRAVAYAKALYLNSARPSGALTYEPKEGPATLSDDAFERLKGEMESQYQGAKNAGRPFVLDGGLKWQPMGLSPKDMEAGEGRSAAAREIAFALGVPPLMLGIKGDNTFANYEEARLAFWKETVWPLAVLLGKKLTAWVRPLHPNAQIRLDQEGSPIAEAEKKTKWDRVRQADFLTVNEKRAEVNYEPIPDGDVLLVNAGQIPLADLLSEGGEGDPDAYEGGLPAIPLQ